MIAALSLAMALQPGTYALDVEIVTEAKVPVLGLTRVHTLSASLVTIEQVGDGWVQEQRTCAVVVRSRGPARTVMPDAFVASLPVQRFAVDLSAGRYRADPGPSTIGAAPDGPLPDAIDAASVRDSDQDGHPGATVWLDVPVLGRVDIYVAQRAHAVLDGHQTPDGAAGGVRVIEMEQRTLGASRAMFHTSPPVAPIDEVSRFELTPLPAGATCRDVKPPAEAPV